MYTAVITQYTPSILKGKAPRVDTQVVELHYSGLYPNPSDIKAVNPKTQVVESLCNLDRSEIAEMLLNGQTSKIVKTSYDSMTASTSYSLFS
ncbi:hypothetical protein [Vibrio phage RYC]|nr:hypothetical protein [Vibrio phage RYC]